MKRPTIALACIAKNEAHNIGPLFSSISGCFDAVYITDTGSTDNTVEILKKDKTKDVVGCDIHVSHFDWVMDFSKARQHSFDQVDSAIDYIMWVDLDDSLGNKEKFIHFRDHSMHCAHMWLAPYNYAFDGKVPVCTFLRERIVKNGIGTKWQFFLHEGLVNDPSKRLKINPIYSWTVDHRRTEADLKKDAGRNLKIFDYQKSIGTKFCPRMQYYYGKELYDASKPLEAIEVLNDVLINHGLELETHDRSMATQYLSQSYAAAEKWAQSLGAAMAGLQLDPVRAEFWILAGDANVRMGKTVESIPFYEGAKFGAPTAHNGFTFTTPYARGAYPRLQIAKIRHAMGDFEGIEREGVQLKEIGDPNSEQILNLAKNIKIASDGPAPTDLLETDDIIITCPPDSVVKNWDERSDKIGGSETACVEVAKRIQKKTGKQVKVFQPRNTMDKMPSGVEYIPSGKLPEYTFKYKPKIHIAWRHSAPLTPAPTYVWSHDLLTHGAQEYKNYEKLFCLSGFHKEFVKDMQQVPDDKIAVISNGIDVDLFKDRHLVTKNPNKIIFSSSPDRGMERCIRIVKGCLDEFPNLELHLFYGFENMRKAGMHEDADYLEKLIRENSFVKYHGFADKKTLMMHFMESAVWLYPADFVETSCISAMEAMAAGTYPIVRSMGALPYTLSEAVNMGMCSMLDRDCITDQDYDFWVNELKSALRDKKWESMDIGPDNYSWDKATDEMIGVLGL